MRLKNKKYRLYFLRLVLSFLMVLGNPMPFIAAMASLSLRAALPAFAASLLFSARRAYARVAYANPGRAVDLSRFNLSNDPTDEDFQKVKAFDEPFVPLEIPADPNENADLAKALNQEVSDKADESLQVLGDFVAQHPHSRWVLSVELNRGLALARRGYFTKALKAFQTAWDAGQKGTGTAGNLADHALSELMRMESRVGLQDELKSELELMKGRTPQGLAARQTEEARMALGAMQKHPDRAFRCGSQALERILAFKKSKKAQDSLFMQTKSTEKGISLDQVYGLSEQLGMGMQMAKREPGAKVLLPAVVHWKLGHYAALLEEKNGMIRSQDTAFMNEIWISEKALNEESSGYFLVPGGGLPAGWSPVNMDEAATIWGKGGTDGSSPPPPCGGGPTSGGGGAQGGTCGMPRTNIDLATTSAMVVDTPLWYKPPVGPEMRFMLTYHQRTPDALPYTNFGTNWNFNWQGFIEYSFSGSQASNYILVARGGGEDPFSGPGGTTKYLTYLVNATTTFSSGPAAGLPSAFTVQKPDGGMETYGLGFANPGGLVKCLLTQMTDPQGNNMTIQYDSMNRIQSVTDALGQQSTFSYGADNYFKVTQITDPFGRHANFTYDIHGFLQSITDQLGLTSSFTYIMLDPAASGGTAGTMVHVFSDAVLSMTTPYGTTTFDYSGTDDTLNKQEVEITDPLGQKEHAKYFDSGTIPDDNLNPPAGIMADANPGSLLSMRNVFYWDKKAMEDDPLDPNSATIYHYLHTSSDLSVRALVLGSWKKPLENRVYFGYTGQYDGYQESSDLMPPLPNVVARYLADGSTQAYHYTYNILGKKTSYMDPKGRNFIYDYANNGIDLLDVKDGNGDMLAAYGNYANHKPGTYTDTAGQVWSYQYNAAGQMTSMRAPQGETTSYNYDSNGFLTSVVSSQPGAGVTYTYDNCGRTHTRSDAANGTLVYHYDNGDRVTRIDFPDLTHETYSYAKLDLVSFTDRQNRTTGYQYDAVQRLTAVTDPKQQSTGYGWCACGALASLTDPKGNKTSWNRDLEGRAISKTYQDGSQYIYQYDSAGERLFQVTDPNQQVTQYKYDTDDKVLNVNYFNVKAATPSVSLAYNDPQLGRLTNMTDSTGTSTYQYYPLNGGQLGAGRIHTITQPVGGTTATIEYTYDADMRVASRSIDGSTESYNYSNGELVGVSNPLGAFTYGYDSASARLSNVGYPNGQGVTFGYFGPSDPLGAGRLKDITNMGAGATAGQVLSKFDYAYDHVGDITQWTKQLGASPTTDERTMTMGYDPASQLSAVTQVYGSGSPSQSVTFGYDASGNRTSEQLSTSGPGSYTHTFGTNNLNQLTSETDNPISIIGSTSLPATVTVNSASVTEDAGSNFSTSILPVAGTSTPLTVRSIAADGQVTTSKFHVLNAAPFMTDANGNLTNDTDKSYGWDAANRLVQINFLGARPATMVDNIQMSYDGFGRRVSITEKHGNTVLSDKRFVWCGAELCQERDATGSTVTKQFFKLGERIGATNYYYTKDHLGNMREMTDSGGTVRARMEYDAYGRSTKLSGDMDADFGYTGFYVNKTTGLDLTWFRAYDPEKGRWLNRDPMGERIGNLYSMVWNNPLKWTDLLGLCGGGGSNQPGTGNPGGGGGPYYGSENPNGYPTPTDTPTPMPTPTPAPPPTPTPVPSPWTPEDINVRNEQSEGIDVWGAVLAAGIDLAVTVAVGAAVGSGAGLLAGVIILLVTPEVLGYEPSVYPPEPGSTPSQCHSN